MIEREYLVIIAKIEARSLRRNLNELQTIWKHTVSLLNNGYTEWNRTTLQDANIESSQFASTI